MQGLHCIADLNDCDPARVRDVTALLAHAQSCVLAAGLSILASQHHQFPCLPSSDGSNTQTDGGVTLTIMLAESHVCIHTWPELNGVTLDVYVCNLLGDNSQKALVLIDALITWFKPGHIKRQDIQRG
jgi:S-adenosylmethionine/arginine decarboxylase-like enzyme